jgi:hypothetical protein
VEPENYKFGGGPAESILHPFVLVAMIVAILLIFVRSRDKISPVFLLAAFLIPHGQQVVIAGVHLFVLRILILAGLVRLVCSKRSSGEPFLGGGWNAVDTVFFLAVVCRATAFTLLYMSQSATVNQAGLLWDDLGGYFLLRSLIRDERDIKTAIKSLAVLALIFAAAMVREQFTGENIFGRLGAVLLYSQTRTNNLVRSQAAFAHGILAGTFAAVILPLFVWLWNKGESKAVAFLGALGSVVMVATSASSTPMLSYAAGVFAIFMWPFRQWMRVFRWSIVLGLVLLQIIMNSPVWYVIAHVRVIGVSSGNHRAELVGTFIEHFSEWWLLGTASNGSWGAFTFDTSNTYVNTGVNGGLAAFVFFIAVLVLCFSRIGRARKAVAGNDRKEEWSMWLLGCTMFVNVVAFFGISYFDQTQVIWFTTLAVVCAATTPVLEAQRQARINQSDEAAACQGVTTVAYE